MAIYETDKLVRFRALGDKASVTAAREAINQALYNHRDAFNWSYKGIRTKKAVGFDAVDCLPKVSAKDFVTASKAIAGELGVELSVSYPSLKGISVVPRRMGL